MSQLRGTGVALVTPYNASQEVDTYALHKLVRHVVDGGVDFLVILGTTGEAAMLSPVEQTLVIDTVLEANGDELPYVIGAGGNDTATVTDRIARLDARYEAGAYLSVVPYYNKPSQTGIYHHFRAISEATDRNVILYNVPGRTSVNMTAETSLSIARDFENVTAIKEASGDMEQCMDLVREAPEGFAVFSGDDTLVLPQLACGMHGIISVAANVIPQAFSSIVNAGLEGNFDQARSSHYRILELMRLLFEEGNPVGIKAALASRGIGSALVRQPLAEADPVLKSKIAQTLIGLS